MNKLTNFAELIMMLFVLSNRIIIKIKQLIINILKDTELIYYTMFKVVSTTMHKNESIWGDNPRLVGCVAQLDSAISVIKDADVNLFNKTKNITVGKKSLRKSVTSQAFLIKDNMRLYFQDCNNIEDMQILTYPISKLKLMTDSDFYVEVSYISEKADEIATQLLPYRITATMINKLKVDLLKFHNITPKRKLLSTTNANLVKFIPAKVKECRLMLRNAMDTLVNSYESTQPRFTIAYTDSRERHLLPGVRKYYTVIINGVITQAGSTAALSNVNISAGKKKKLTTTDIKGNYIIKIYTKDADTITFSHPGFETQTIAIKLIEPEKHKKAELIINVELVKNNTNIRLK